MASEPTTVLITGGTSGIGRATAQLFADQEASVIITGRDESPGRETAAQTKGRFNRADLASPGDVQRLAAEAGEVDVLVLAAASPLGRADEPDEAARGIVYLAGERARPITGTVLAVDAGRVSAL